MEDTSWIRNYNSKVLLVTTGTNNTWGLRGHRLAAWFRATSHVSIMLSPDSGNVAWGICANGNGNMYIGKRTSGSYTDATGDKYILTISGTALSVTGNIIATGEITAYSSSDARLKEQVTPLRSATEMLARLRPVRFRWNALARQLNPEKDTRLNYGLIAQQTRCVMPELVHTVYGEYLSLDYEQLISVLVAANQELTKRVTELEEKLGIKAA